MGVVLSTCPIAATAPQQDHLTYHMIIMITKSPSYHPAIVISITSPPGTGCTAQPCLLSPCLRVKTTSEFPSGVTLGHSHTKVPSEK